MNFGTYLQTREEWQELFEDAAIKKLLLSFEFDSDITKLIAQMDREELSALSAKLRLYEAHRKANQEALWAHKEREFLRGYLFTHREKRRILAERAAELGSYRECLEPGSRTERTIAQAKLLEKLKRFKEGYTKRGSLGNPETRAARKAERKRIREETREQRKLLG